MDLRKLDDIVVIECPRVGRVGERGMRGGKPHPGCPQGSAAGLRLRGREPDDFVAAFADTRPGKRRAERVQYRLFCLHHDVAR